MGLAVHSCLILCFSVLVVTATKSDTRFDRPGRFVFNLTGIPFFAASVNSSCNYNTTVCGLIAAVNQIFTIPAGTNIPRGRTNILVLGSHSKAACININGSSCPSGAEKLGELYVYNNKTVSDQTFRANFSVSITFPTLKLTNVKYESYVYLFGRMRNETVNVLFMSGANLTGEAFNVIIKPRK
ncbi:hypothetical protein SprV_0401694700 [Sparganum proliferum]